MLPVAAIASVRQVTEAYQSSSAATGVTSTSFADLLGDAARTALQSMRDAETTTAQGLAGKTDTQAVVAALSNAELTMQTVVAVRDRILGAYNDVIRMNI
jgi:flagellar hook-basal body complex protein FliE